MSSLKPLTELDTHEVLNQPPPLEGVALYGGDRALVQALRCAGGGVHGERLEQLGKRCGSAEVIGWGEDANRQLPVLDTHDRFGRRIDEVRFHPAYHELMRLGLESGFAASGWDGSEAGHVLHADRKSHV